MTILSPQVTVFTLRNNPTIVCHHSRHSCRHRTTGHTAGTRASPRPGPSPPGKGRPLSHTALYSASPLHYLHLRHSAVGTQNTEMAETQSQISGTLSTGAQEWLKHTPIYITSATRRLPTILIIIAALSW